MATSGTAALVTLALTAAASIIVARSYGPTGYAIFVFTGLVVLVGSLVAGAGLPLAVSRHVGALEAGDEVRRLVASTLKVGALAGACVGGVVSLALPIVEQWFGLEVGRGLAWALPCAVALAVVSDVGQCVYYGLLRPHASLVITATGPLATIGYVLIARAGAPLPLWGAIVTSQVVSGLVAVAALRRDRLLSRGAPLTAVSVLAGDMASAAAYTTFSTLGAWVDRFIVGTVLGPGALGGYTSATLLVQAALRGPLSVAYLLIPASRRSDDAADVGTNGQAAVVRDALDPLLLTAFGIFAGATTAPLVIAAPEVLGLIFGSGFAFAATTLRILAPLAVVSALSVPLLAALTGSRRDTRVPAVIAAALVARILLILALTTWWGIEGAAAATVFAELVVLVLSVVVARRSGLLVRTGVLAAPAAMTGVAVAGGLLMVYLGLPPLLVAAAALLPFALMAARLQQRVRDHDARLEA